MNDVAVVGVPDDRAGELPRAYVVRKNRNVLEQDIIDYVAEHAAPHKRSGIGTMNAVIGADGKHECLSLVNGSKSILSDSLNYVHIH